MVEMAVGPGVGGAQPANAQMLRWQCEAGGASGKQKDSLCLNLSPSGTHALRITMPQHADSTSRT